MAVKPPGDPAQPTRGYWYGSPPVYGGQGSMAGPSGTGVRAALAPSAWHPTVINLLVLVVLEIIAYGLLRYAFRTFHGG